MKNNYYKTRDFDYALPEQLIAKYPLTKRSDSRLLVINRKTQQIAHQQFTDLIDLINPNDLVLFNDTKVIPARILGHKKTGGKVEVLIERITSTHTALAHIRSSKSPKTDSELIFADNIIARVMGREDDLFQLEFLTDNSVLDLLYQIGQIPLPPYLERQPEKLDQDRYQTVFAAREGAVAAPTASLHFDQAMLDTLAAKGVETAMVTLHVGAGTFQPVRVETLSEHIMHKEYVDVSAEVCERIKHTKARQGRVIAIGTTVVRCLETASKDRELSAYQGDTQLFIYPGYDFQVVDVLFTNFHLPKSTLLMLVCAFGGHELIMAAYQQAVEQEYRFFSYGDACFISSRFSAAK